VSRRRSRPDAERRLQRGSSPRWRGNRVFYVAVEGEKTEPEYLSYLNREFGDEHQFVIQALPRSNGMKPSEVVERAAQERRDSGDDDLTQYWAVFDRDQHTDIPQAMRAATEGGIKVAFSHPSFDLWLLLHFMMVRERQHGASQWIHEKLREQSGFERFGSASGDKGVQGARVAALTGRHEVAAGRAKKLVDECPTGQCSAESGHAHHCDPCTRDPSTDVWRLLVELGIVAQ
jgi:hypothetical protein